MQSQEPKICRKCKWYKEANLCEHPGLGIDLVTGKKIRAYADDRREDQGTCGPEGEEWAPREHVSIKDKIASLLGHL